MGERSLTRSRLKPEAGVRTRRRGDHRQQSSLCSLAAQGLRHQQPQSLEERTLDERMLEERMLEERTLEERTLEERLKSLPGSYSLGHLDFSLFHVYYLKLLGQMFPLGENVAVQRNRPYTIMMCRSKGYSSFTRERWWWSGDS